MSRRKFGPFRILKKLGTNAYLLDIPDDVPTSPVFNVADLFLFHGEPPDSIEIATLPFADVSIPTEEYIEDVVDVRTSKTRNGVRRRYLVRWRDRPLTDCSWIDEVELRHRREDLFQRLSEAFSTESSFSHQREIDVA